MGHSRSSRSIELSLVPGSPPDSPDASSTQLPGGTALRPFTSLNETFMDPQSGHRRAVPVQARLWHPLCLEGPPPPQGAGPAPFVLGYVSASRPRHAAASSRSSSSSPQGRSQWEELAFEVARPTGTVEPRRLAHLGTKVPPLRRIRRPVQGKQKPRLFVKVYHWPNQHVVLHSRGSDDGELTPSRLTEIWTCNGPSGVQIPHEKTGLVERCPFVRRKRRQVRPDGPMPSTSRSGRTRPSDGLVSGILEDNDESGRRLCWTTSSRQWGRPPL